MKWEQFRDRRNIDRDVHSDFRNELSPNRFH